MNCKTYHLIILLCAMVSSPVYALELDEPISIVVPGRVDVGMDVLVQQFIASASSKQSFRVINNPGGFGMKAVIEFEKSSATQQPVIVINSDILVKNKLQETPLEYLKSLQVIGSLTHTTKYLWVNKEKIERFVGGTTDELMSEIRKDEGFSIAGKNTLVDQLIATKVLQKKFVAMDSAMQAIEAVAKGEANASLASVRVAYPYFLDGKIAPVWSADSPGSAIPIFTVLAAHPSLAQDEVDHLKNIFQSSEPGYRERAISYIKTDGCDDECETGDGTSALCADAILTRLLSDDDDDGCECEQGEDGKLMLCADRSIDLFFKKN